MLRVLKMITINGRSYPTFTIDTTETIFARYASELNTLPDFLKITKLSNSVYDVVDELHSKYISKNYIDLPLQVLAVDDASTQERGLRVFIATNIYLEENANQRRFLFEEIQRQLLASSYAIDVERVWQSRNVIIDELDAEVRRNRAEVERFKVVAIKFDETLETPFDDYVNRKSTIFNFKIDTTMKYLTGLFDAINTTTRIPFVYISTWDGNEFYKVHRNFRPRFEWTDRRGENIIYAKVFDGKNDYVDCGMKFDDGTIICTLNVKHHKKNRDGVEKFISETFDTLFIGGYRIIERREIGIVADIYFPNIGLDADVMSDIVMNDDTASSIIVIDEFIKASKIKKNIYAHSLLRANETINYLEKMTEKHNQFTKFPSAANQPYVRCQIKADSTERLLTLRSIAAKILTISVTRRDDIVSFYRRYIPSFGKLRRVPATKKRKVAATSAKEVHLRDIAPEIFVSQYPRKCAHKPTIVDDDYRTADLQTMDFPTKGEATTRRYVCDKKKEYKYPGLMVNPLSNKDVFPFVPCCYSKDQSTKEASAYRQYFFDDADQDRLQYGRVASRPKHQYSTNKILPPNIIGNLPDVVHKLFVACDIDPHYAYKRLGVSRTPFSALEVVLRAKSMFEEMTTAATSTYLKRTVDDLKSKPSLVAATLQETSDDTESSYFSIRKYVHMLEEAYDCDIFIFDPKTLVVPSHVEMYCKYKPSRRVIFIYEHWGSESDNAQYPQCELVVKSSAENYSVIDDYNFEPDSNIVLKISGIFDAINRCVILDEPQTTFPQLRRHIFDADVCRQYVDVYGKCRGVLLCDGNIPIEFAIPYPPYAVPTVDSRFSNAVDVNVLMETFVKKYKLKIDGKIVTTRNVYVSLNDAKYFVRVTYEPILLNDMSAKIYLPEALRYDIDDKLVAFNDARRYVDIYKNIVLKTYTDSYSTSDYNEITTTLNDMFRTAFIKISPSSSSSRKRYKIQTYDASYASIRDMYYNSVDGKLSISSLDFLDRMYYVTRMLLKYHPILTTTTTSDDDKIKNIFAFPVNFINDDPSNVVIKPNLVETYLRMEESNTVYSKLQRDKRTYLLQNVNVYDGVVVVARDCGDDLNECLNILNASNIDNLPIFVALAPDVIEPSTNVTQIARNSILTYEGDEGDEIRYVALLIS